MDLYSSIRVFFRPHPEKLLHQYHFTPDLDDEQRSRDLNPPPNFDAIAAEAQGMFSDAGSYLEYANSHYIWAVATWAARQREPKGRAEALYNYINYHIVNTPKNQERPFTLSDLGGYEPRVYVYPRLERVVLNLDSVGQSDQNPPVGMFVPLVEWQVVDSLQCCGNGSLMPHSVVSIVSKVYTTPADQSLTVHEVRAILRLMITRVNTDPYVNQPIVPILVFSYLAPCHGRIIQASYDGLKLNLQHTQLWSFEHRETDLVELFVRYNVGQPMGLVNSTLCFR